jgi:hypothetical protein
MKEKLFNSIEEAIGYLSNITGQKVIVAEAEGVENPRTNPENKVQEDNWKKAEMWGDYKNHKYPLFDKKTGKLSVKRAMTALRYLNQAKSKDSYPKIEEASNVLSKIAKTIFKLDPKAKVEYQPKDKMYQSLPESIKSKMDGYESKAKKASREVLKIAGDEKKEAIQDMKRLLKKMGSSKLDHPVQKALKKEDRDSKEISLSNMTCRQAIDAIADYVGGEDQKEEITPEEVEAANKIEI